MQYSFMTMTIYFKIMEKVQNGLSMEEAKQEYKKMLCIVAKAGIPAVDITTIEVDSIGMENIKNMLDDTGLKVGSLIHVDQYATTETSESARVIANAKEAVLKAFELKTDDMMLAVSGHPGIETSSRETLCQALVHNITPIALYGKEHGIRISVEDTPDIFERYAICRHGCYG